MHIMVDCNGWGNSFSFQFITHGGRGKIELIWNSVRYKWTFRKSSSLQLMYLLECKWEIMVATHWSWSGGISWHFKVYSPLFHPTVSNVPIPFRFCSFISPSFPNCFFLAILLFFVIANLGNLLDYCWPRIQKLLFCDGKLEIWFIIIYVAFCFITHKVAQNKHLNSL